MTLKSLVSRKFNAVKKCIYKGDLGTNLGKLNNLCIIGNMI